MAAEQMVAPNQAIDGRRKKSEATIPQMASPRSDTKGNLWRRRVENGPIRVIAIRRR